jgi:Tol biopolymer transport system component
VLHHRADVSSGNTPPFTKSLIYSHSTEDSKGPSVNEDGSAVVFGRNDDVVMVWTAAEGTARVLASNTYDFAGAYDISADGNWAAYETKSVDNIELTRTASGSAAALVVNEDATQQGETASDPSVSGNGDYVAYVRDRR